MKNLILLFYVSLLASCGLEKNGDSITLTSGLGGEFFQGDDLKLSQEELVLFNKACVAFNTKRTNMTKRVKLTHKTCSNSETQEFIDLKLVSNKYFYELEEDGELNLRSDYKFKDLVNDENEYFREACIENTASDVNRYSTKGTQGAVLTKIEVSSDVSKCYPERGFLLPRIENLICVTYQEGYKQTEDATSYVLKKVKTWVIYPPNSDNKHGIILFQSEKASDSCSTRSDDYELFVEELITVL